MNSKRFRIALSFAGEKRDFVAKTAAILAKRFGEVGILYDKYHEAEFSRARLGRYLPKLYHDESDLVVLVLCKDYAQKEWCGLEWDAIFDLLKKRKENEVMLCRFDNATIEGLYSDAGFSEFDRRTPAQAAALILERLALNEGKPKNCYAKAGAKSAVRSAANIPNNLPRPQPFFGREPELKKIAQSLTRESRGWGALIDGPGGIGKTALAIRAAEMVPDERFRRIIFLSSKERELTADGQRALGHFVLPSYLEMLNAIARELEQPDLAKSAEAERSDAILRSLREADVLLVLDNLETLPEGDRDQLFAFLSRLPSGCSAIVTSRRRADASASAVRLDRLDWPAARDFLAEIAKNNDKLAKTTEPERRALYEETGGNPLLMRWVAGQLGLGRCKTIAAALDFLRSAPAGNNPLEFIFGDLLDTFSENETKVLAALTHFTSTMPAKFIAELAGLNEAAAQGALSDLSSRALVLPDLEERNFSLVPMVADFLRKKKREVVAEIGNRLERRAYALIVENGYSNHQRFPKLDAAWPTVAPALSLFLAGENSQLQTVCDALQLFFEFTGRWDEWLSLIQQAEATALVAGDPNNAGWRANDAAYIYYLRQNANAVLTCADRAAAHWQEAKAGTRERAVAMRSRSHGYMVKGDYAAAITAFTKALNLDRSLSAESVDVASGLNWLANAERCSLDFAAAERHYDESLRISKVVGFREGVSVATSNLAKLALARNNWSRAEMLSGEALNLCEKVGRQGLIADNCRMLAEALLHQENAAKALPHARRAVDIFAKLGSPELSRARETLTKCEEQLSRG